VPLTSGRATTATLYRASVSRGILLVLAHGAGAGQHHPFMTAMASRLAARHIDVVTFDFPYMHEGRKVPDRVPALEACFAGVIDWALGIDGLDRHRLIAGGKSMGGRMATHLGAAGLVARDGRGPALGGVIALGYPLHPPGRPDQPRTAHLPSIAVPLLIVQGSRDTFGTPQELKPVIATMRAPVTLHVVDGGDHSFAVSRTPREQVLDGVADVVIGWADSSNL
jgi:predicted alpha/beta-hydrolase family hydrolase